MSSEMSMFRRFSLALLDEFSLVDQNRFSRLKLNRLTIPGQRLNRHRQTTVDDCPIKFFLKKIRLHHRSSHLFSVMCSGAITVGDVCMYVAEAKSENRI